MTGDVLNDEIWIIDDHPLFSEGLKHMIAAHSKRYKIHCFRGPQELPRACPGKLALLILDYYIPGADTLELIRNFSAVSPHTPVVVISSSTSLADKQLCLAQGASAYIPKHAPPDVTLNYLVRYLEGSPVDQDAAIELRPERHQLTAKQVEILIQVARGYSNKKIAVFLQVSPETVKSHLAAIYRQIDCSNRDEAVQWARDKGLV